MTGSTVFLPTTGGGPVSTTPVDAVSLEARATALCTRSIKTTSKQAALHTTIRCIDLTTLEGTDTPGKVASLCQKAIRPDPANPAIPSVAAVCGDPELAEHAAGAGGGTGAVRDRGGAAIPGDPAPPGAPRQHKGLKFFWAPLHWDDHVTHMGVFEDADGHQMHWDGFILPAYGDPDDIPGIEDPGIERLLRVQHDLAFVSGTRRISGGRITLDRVDRDPLVIDLEPLVTARMKGMGYGHSTWGHGHWKGELAMEGESWRLDEVDEMSPENLHVQSVVRATCGDRTGIGVLEQIVVGPYPRYGFTEFLDPAR